jgi:thioredoxin reductase
MHLRVAMRVDAVIVGGGPAGLSAALVLGRCRRNVVVFDDRNYRNRDAHRVRGFLTRDRDTSPESLRALARADLETYPTVRIVHETVVDARRTEHGFAVLTKSGEQLDCGALLLATGFRDRLPAVGGARELHGDRVVPCPYCDAWEVRDQPLAAFSHPDDRGAAFAAALAQWSSDVVLCAERRPAIGTAQLERLLRRGIRVEQRELRSVESDGDGVRLIFAEGGPLWRRRLFYHLGGEPASNLATRLGADVDDKGSAIVDRVQQASIPGLFVAGDATRDALQAIVGAGEGAGAAIAINEHLCQRE